ncbi:uncharacterized protein LOC124143723 [Haliotis rufescens]|uniref:uncharacterized protein LOC124143723 n=1 Tax=Haliotis rufescens TaxID=6454 RepID=UPI00201F162B|nr:uncharacterized protein LOC124143723 [Haliotis rufescens]
MPPSKMKRIQVKPRVRTRRENAEYRGYSVTSTFLNLPEEGAVLVPWRVLQTDPIGVSKSFRLMKGKIMYDDWINVMMAATDLQESIFGSMDELSQTWVTQVTSHRDLGDMLYRLTSFPTLVGATVRSSSLLDASVEIPIVVVLQPKAQCIDDLVDNLQSLEDDEPLEKFYFEVDLGPAIKRWVKQVLRDDFTVTGGRFAVGKGTPFNHLFDWQNVFCCVPCLPCCLVASPLYRAHRKLRYQESFIEVNESIVIVGAETNHPEDQAIALRNLMAWTKAVGTIHTCDACGLPVRGALEERCVCDSDRILDEPVMQQKAPLDTKQEEIKRKSPRNHRFFHRLGGNKMQTLADIHRFNVEDWRVRREVCLSSDSSTKSLIGREGVTPRDVTASVGSSSASASESSGKGKGRRFSITELRVFSIACNRVQPTNQADPSSPTLPPDRQPSDRKCDKS